MQNKKFEDTINEFYLVCSEFCKLLENISVIPKLNFLSKSQKILNLIYLKASLIEKPKTIDEEEAEKFVTENDWIFIKDRVSSKLSYSDKIIELTLPENYDPENTESVTISECFADIYQDLRDFSTNYEIGNHDAILVSVFECLDNFEKFWGIRALSIMVSIHNLIYGDESLEDEEIDGQLNHSDKNSQTIKE